MCTPESSPPQPGMSAPPAPAKPAAAPAVLLRSAAVSQEQVVDGAILLCTVVYQWQAQPASLSWRDRALLALHAVFAAFYLRSGIDITGQFFKAQTAPDGPFGNFLALGDKDASGKKWLVERFVKFMQSTYLLHGLIRAYTSLEFDNKIARQNALLSYVCEIFQNAPLVSATSEAAPADSFRVAIVMALWLASLDGHNIDKESTGSSRRE